MARVVSSLTFVRNQHLYTIYRDYPNIAQVVLAKEPCIHADSLCNLGKVIKLSFESIPECRNNNTLLMMTTIQSPFLKIFRT